MKTLPFALSVILAGLAASGAYAATSSGTIPVTTTIVPGNTVSVYLIGGEILTDVGNGASPGGQPFGVAPVARIEFELQQSWVFVKRVTWNRARHQLTIDL